MSGVELTPLLVYGEGMNKIDITFIHAPATYDFRERSIMYGPVSDLVPSTPIFEMYPLGLTTLSEYLERHGIRSRLYNLASMMLHKRNFDVEKNLSRLESRCFGIDLHWMPHCHGSIEVSKVLKRLHPEVPVIFGGLSSSIFHADLIKYDSIDYVFRGDSTEEPMRILLDRIVRAEKTKSPVGDLSDIPNLTWKDSTGAVHINPLSWVPDTMDSISLDYAYPMKGVLRHRDLTSYLPMKGWFQYPICASLTSRGCSRNCATCGGSAYSFRNHFGRKRVAWRDPKLLIRDIETVQSHIWGPIFVLNDFLQAGPEYAQTFVEGLKGKVHSPIGFEFFGPPKQGKELYQLLDDNLESWSVEISAESHDDDVRAAFGKGHYTMRELEQTIIDALSFENCERFDLYFMTGIPKQTAASVRETGEYVRHLYQLVNYDPRLVVLTSPMAPFLDVGSIVFDNPEQYGYNLRARTFEEHRERMVLPSWKHIMNYESKYMSADEMVEATYDAALDLNKLKGEFGLLDPNMTAVTEKRIVEARRQMRRLDDVLENGTGKLDDRLKALKEEFERLSESTVAEKSELNWGSKMQPVQVKNIAKLVLSNVPQNFIATLQGRYRPAASDFDYSAQVNGVHSPVYQPDESGKLVETGTDQLAAEGSVVAPGFSTDEVSDAFEFEIAKLEAGRAGTSTCPKSHPAIREETLAAVKMDELFLRALKENKNGKSEPENGSPERARMRHSLQGAGGIKGFVEARRIERHRARRVSKARERAEEGK